MNRKLFLSLFLYWCIALPVGALTFPLPRTGDVVGQIQTTTVRQGESLGDIGRRYDVGTYEMIEANPALDPWVPPPGAQVIIPTQYILPKGPRSGIVLNLAEMRLYHYHSDKPLVTTYPIGIGKKGWSTPLGQTTITGKKQHPSWTPPASIRKEHLAKGEVLPAMVPAGPENPLGHYAFYLGLKGFLLHGSNRPTGVGVRSSHGCIRMLPEDIELLFHQVPVGTAVRIVHEPFKAGWHNNHLYIEAHQPLTESQYVGSNSLTHLEKEIQRAVADNGASENHLVNWSSATHAAKVSSGYPVQID